MNRWRLVTNVSFNPTDEKRWDDEVVPLFEGQGLEADKWLLPSLEALLAKHPEVSRAFFEGESRVFLTAPEFRDRFVANEPFPVAVRAEFQGRTSERQSIHDFLSSEKLFLIAHGAGGIGKTRLLLEAGAEIAAQGDWQVLWANVATLTASTGWLQGIVPERPTLLLVDEPEDETVLKLLAEQLSGRASQWKVAIAVRSPKDPVLKFLAATRMKPRVQELAIDPLSRIAAEALAASLLEAPAFSKAPGTWKQETAVKLAARFSRHPIWITLAVHLLETHRDLTRVPETAAGLAEEYLDEIVKQQAGEPAAQVLSLLRWVALIGTVNRQDETVVRLLAAEVGVDGGDRVLEMISRLVQRKALRQRGAHDRLVELKPDVLRDHVLRSWLVLDPGFGGRRASEQTNKLLASVTEAIERGGLSSLGRAILISVARTELMFRLTGESVPLLDPFFSQMYASIPGLRVSSKLALSEVLTSVAGFRIGDTVKSICALRVSTAEPETVKTMFGTRTLTRDDVTLSLAWPLFHAAPAAQELDERVAVLDELCSLVEAEAEAAPRVTGGLPNDGHRAASLLRQVLEGGPYFWSSFDDAAAVIGERLLDRVAREVPTVGLDAAIRALLLPTLAVERHQTWSEGNSLHVRRYVITDAHPGWRTRKVLIAKLQALLVTSGVPVGSRLVLWSVLGETHQLGNSVAVQGAEPVKGQMRAEVLSDLQWVRGVLSNRAVPFEEIKAAMSPPTSAGTTCTGITGDQGPTRWRGDGSSPWQRGPATSASPSGLRGGVRVP